MIRVRFAPSPTGYLHIGGARTALFNHLFARRHQGVFILRIEDTDEVRSSHESVDAILESLAWLGLEWDEGPRLEPGRSGDWQERGNFAPYFQMRRLERYRQYVEQLLREGKAYRCYCTPEELDAMRRRAQLEKRPPRYEGRCRSLTEAQRRDHETQGRRASVRFRMPDEDATAVEDVIRGRVEFENRLLQDFVIQKTAGGPTYNFACVVDDHLMEITHVIRGDEHLSNTPSQLQVYAGLGWKPPQFAHLSMILGPDGAKLSKRHGATSVLEYKTQGFLPQALRNYLALLGWATPDSRQLFEAAELIGKFDLKGCQKNPATFDPQKLQWMNGTYIRKLTREELVRESAPFLESAGLGRVPREPLLRAVGLEAEKVKLLTEVPRLVDFFFKDAVYEQKAVEKVLRAPGAAKILEDIRALLQKTPGFLEKDLEAAIRGFCAGNNLKPAQAIHPIRVAVSGRTEGPSLFAMLEVLGREKVLERIGAAQRLI
ncbi:MAG: glutamate--tRNA ligase [Elusimicrobia bacterium]|nr:glutamate--tRNA ligase [Elusimicrobiota bacterium]